MLKAFFMAIDEARNLSVSHMHRKLKKTHAISNYGIFQIFHYNAIVNWFFLYIGFIFGEDNDFSLFSTHRFISLIIYSTLNSYNFS